MKSVIIAIVIAVTIVFSSIIYGHHMNKVSKTLVSINDSLVTEINEENYSKATDILDNIVSYIETQRTVLSATDNHEVLNKIDINLHELYSYIEGGQKTDALSKCGALDFLFRHLPKNYELSVENIL